MQPLPSTGSHTLGVFQRVPGSYWSQVSQMLQSGNCAWLQIFVLNSHLKLKLEIFWAATSVSNNKRKVFWFKKIWNLCPVYFSFVLVPTHCQEWWDQGTHCQTSGPGTLQLFCNSDSIKFEHFLGKELFFCLLLEENSFQIGKSNSHFCSSNVFPFKQ